MSETYSMLVLGRHVTITVDQDGTSMPAVYAARITADHAPVVTEGYGTTMAEAIVDLFRVRRNRGEFHR